MAQYVEIPHVMAYHTIDALRHLPNPTVVEEMRIHWGYPKGPHYVAVRIANSWWLTSSEPSDLKAIVNSIHPHVHIIMAWRSNDD